MSWENDQPTRPSQIPAMLADSTEPDEPEEFDREDTQPEIAEMVDVRLPRSPTLSKLMALSPAEILPAAIEAAGAEVEGSASAWAAALGAVFDAMLNNGVPMATARTCFAAGLSAMRKRFGVEACRTIPTD